MMLQFLDGHIPVPGDQYDGGVDNLFMGGQKFDPGLHRPYFDSKGRPSVTLNTGRTEIRKGPDGKPVCNAAGEPIYFPQQKKHLIGNLMSRGFMEPVFNATSLTKDQWIHLDGQILKEARQRLRAWSDLSAASSYGGFDAYGKSVVEFQNMSDPGQAKVDMDGISDDISDSPLVGLEAVPLPITHAGFWFSKRQLQISRNSGMPLDTAMGEAAGRRVAEMVEKTLIGEETGITYTTSTNYSLAARVFGYTNFTNRNTYTTITTPLGTNPSATVTDVLAMRQAAFDDHFYGPYMLYHSPDWDEFLDNDYFAVATSGMASPSQTLRQRIRQIDGIQDVRRLDFSTETFNLILVQMTPDVVQAINGMGITTVQWESKGGQQINFRVMAIMVPRIRSDYSGRCGIVHGTTS